MFGEFDESSQIIPVLNKIFISFCHPPKNIFKPFYKFCNILIPNRAGPNKKQFAGFARAEISARLNPLMYTVIRYSWENTCQNIQKFWVYEKLKWFWVYEQIFGKFRKIFWDVTTRLLFSKLLLILLFSHKILIF